MAWKQEPVDHPPAQRRLIRGARGAPKTEQSHMPLPLIRHPCSKGDACRRIKADCHLRAGNELNIAFELDANTSALAIPARGGAERKDNLWQTTCFELFLAKAGDHGYWEFNFSPSTDWAVYRFFAYRKDQRKEQAISMLDIQLHQEPTRFGLNANVPLGEIIGDSCADHISIGLSAIVEQTDGAVSYWALAHPPGEPDFHHECCFTLPLRKEE